MTLMRRTYREGIELSIVGFGGMLAVGMGQDRVDALVAESIERGVNYFDVSPFYGNGEAEEKLGCALKFVRQNIFLAGKTFQRTAVGAEEDLTSSLARLQTDHFDLYQIHAVTTLKEVETIFAPGGAMEFIATLRSRGLARFLGFSAHSAEAALALLDRFDFDSVMLPVNFVCEAHGGSWNSVMRRAAELGTARIALKAMALTRWGKNEAREFPKCWYKPLSDPVLACQALRFALSEDVTAALPPGEESLYRLALQIAEAFVPMTETEQEDLLEGAQTIRPLLKI